MPLQELLRRENFTYKNSTYFKLLHNIYTIFRRLHTHSYSSFHTLQVTILQSQLFSFLKKHIINVLGAVESGCNYKCTPMQSLDCKQFSASSW